MVNTSSCHQAMGVGLNLEMYQQGISPVHGHDAKSTADVKLPLLSSLVKNNKDETLPTIVVVQ